MYPNATTAVDFGPVHWSFSAADPTALFWFCAVNIAISSILPLPLSSVLWVVAVVLYGFGPGFVLHVHGQLREEGRS